MKRQPALAAVLVLIAVGAGVLAFAPAQAQPVPSPCVGANHCLDVTIGGGKVNDVANVKVDNKNHQIWWEIKTPGYSFAAPPKPDAVKFKAPSAINDNGRMPAGEFQCNRAQPRVFRCTDLNTTHGTGPRSYQYEITVVEDATGREIVLDPWVINW